MKTYTSIRIRKKQDKNNIIYLSLLIALSLNFWGVKPFGLWNNDIFLVMKLGYLIFGYIFIFKGQLSLTDRRLKPFWFIILGILLSMVTANLFYGQSFQTSFIAYRVNFLWLAVPVLFKMRPTFRQIAKSSLIITVIMYVLYFIRFSRPDLFTMDEEALIKIQQGENTYLSGYVIASIPIFYYLDKLHNKINTYDILVIALCYVYIFILQNRTQLFLMTALIGISILQVRSKYKFFLIAMLAAFLAYFIISTLQEWLSLIQETQNQIGDSDYNRNKAYLYFFAMASPNIWCQLFGNGFLSSNTTNLMQDMMAMGIYNSDVGFVGYWNQYGVIPIIAFLYTFIIAFKGKNVHYGIKMWCLFLAGCSLTIGYFHGAPLIYVFYYYLVEQYSKQNFLKESA